jgi:hypothetical protein
VAVTMKNAVFWDVTLCGSCKNRHISEQCSASIIRMTRIGELGTTSAVTSNRHTLRRNTKLYYSKAYRNTMLYYSTVFLHSVRQLLVTANVVPSSLIYVSLMMGALHFSRMLVLTRGTQRNIPEDSVLYRIVEYQFSKKHVPGTTHDGQLDQNMLCEL